MLGNYLLSLYRSLTRRGLYAGLNLLGLAAGIAVFLVLTLFIRFETSFERWIPDAQEIYEIRTTVALPGVPIFGEWTSMGGMLSELQTDYPQIVGTRSTSVAATIDDGVRISPVKVEIVDRNFLDIFKLPLIAGDRATALADPSGLVITEAEARKYFGEKSPIGKTLKIVIQGIPHLQHVTGLIGSLPLNTDLSFGLLIPSFDHPSGDYRWGNNEVSTYLLFHDPTKAAALNKELDAFVDRHAVGDLGSLARHPHTLFEERAVPLLAAHLLAPDSSAMVVTLGAVALLTLLIAAVNYVNLATAGAVLRAREVAMRKVLGATRRVLAIQFMVEALVIVSFGALVGLALTEVVLPMVNAAGGTNLALHYFGGESVLPTLAIIIPLVGIAAGAYPALIISNFQPAAVLASTRSPSGGRVGARIREALVVFQFVVAIAFTVCTAILLAQTSYMQHADLGFQRDGLVLTSSLNDQTLTPSQRKTILETFRSVPGVIDATEAEDAPGDDSHDSEFLMSRPGRLPTTLEMVMTGPQYFSAYGSRLLAGRWLDSSHGLDDASGRAMLPFPWANGESVVVNALAVKALGFADPLAAIGQTIRLNAGLSFTIVGVTENLRFHSPLTPLKPTVYFMRSQVPNRDYSVAAIRYRGSDPGPILTELRSKWRQLAPSVPLTTVSGEQSLSAYYRVSQQRSRLFTLGAVGSELIGCVGLFGLASFATGGRSKEIGVRKTLGASTGNVLWLLLAQFLRPVLIASLVAWPLVYVAMRQWLNGFEQRISLSPTYFIFATALAVAIAAGTVAGQAFQLARIAPSWALRQQ